jgi:hypothetical protein
MNAPVRTDRSDGVGVRTLLAGGLPLLLVLIGSGGQREERLREALTAAGLGSLPGFLGHDLPKGAKVGFVLEGEELRLVDERDDTLLRAPRHGLDPDWLEAARRLRGTMLVALTDGLDDPELAPRELAAAVDEHARAGAVLGAIVGVVEERPSLPLIF